MSYVINGTHNRSGKRFFRRGGVGGRLFPTLRPSLGDSGADSEYVETSRPRYGEFLAGGCDSNGREKPTILTSSSLNSGHATARPEGN